MTREDLFGVCLTTQAPSLYSTAAVCFNYSTYAASPSVTWTKVEPQKQPVSKAAFRRRLKRYIATSYGRNVKGGDGAVTRRQSYDALQAYRHGQ